MQFPYIHLKEVPGYPFALQYLHARNDQKEVTCFQRLQPMAISFLLLA